MRDLLATLDGTGRAPFPLQAEFLTWLQDQTARVVAGQLPPGVGKSFIVRTVQRATGATVITPSNILIDQYRATYPDVNYLKGKAHYKCSTRGMSCEDVRSVLEAAPCSECTYRQCRSEALGGAATFFNPMSLHQLVKTGHKVGGWVVVDEAHKLKDMLILAATEAFGADKFRLPESTHAQDVLDWLRHQATVVERWAKRSRELKAATDFERVTRLVECLSDSPEDFVITFGEDRGVRQLRLAPTLPPRTLLRRILGEGRILLLSGTLSRLEVGHLAPNEDFAYLDMPSPIPANQREVLYSPYAPASDKALYDHIVATWEAHGKPNALVHVTYDLSERLSKFCLKHLRNTSDNKDKVVKQFKQHGGLFFAAGCAEGLDLPDDQCRLNIIPVLPRPNMGDPGVKKWLAAPNGSKRYDLETLRTFQQQVGRSTRHVRDHSLTVVMDPRFPRLVQNNTQDLSESFRASINWTGKRRQGG